MYAWTNHSGSRYKRPHWANGLWQPYALEIGFILLTLSRRYRTVRCTRLDCVPCPVRTWQPSNGSPRLIGRRGRSPREITGSQDQLLSQDGDYLLSSPLPSSTTDARTCIDVVYSASYFGPIRDNSVVQSGGTCSWLGLSEFVCSTARFVSLSPSYHSVSLSDHDNFKRSWHQSEIVREMIQNRCSCRLPLTVNLFLRPYNECSDVLCHHPSEIICNLLLCPKNRKKIQFSYVFP